MIQKKKKQNKESAYYVRYLKVKIAVMYFCKKKLRKRVSPGTWPSFHDNYLDFRFNSVLIIGPNWSGATRNQSCLKLVTLEFQIYKRIATLVKHMSGTAFGPGLRHTLHLSKFIVNVDSFFFALLKQYCM